MKTQEQKIYRSTRARKLLWVGLLCLFLTLAMTHQFFPGDQAMVTSAQGTLPEVFYTFIPFVN